MIQKSPEASLPVALSAKMHYVFMVQHMEMVVIYTPVLSVEENNIFPMVILYINRGGRNEKINQKIQLKTILDKKLALP
jgi:hypothetical protein